MQQVNLDRERMETEHSAPAGEQQSEIEKLKMRIGALKADLENAQQNLLTVRSPYEGVIISMDQRTVGSVVQQGQVLCQLAPKDAKTRARMTLNRSWPSRNSPSLSACGISSKRSLTSVTAL